MKNGLPIPDRIENAPSLWPGLELYYIGFLDLNSSRSMGMSPGPIGWITINQYSEAKGLDEEQMEAMQSHIAAMDSIFLEHQRKKHK